MTPLTSREATIRFAGVVVLAAVGYLHLMDISHKIQEGIWYMAFLFAVLIIASLVLGTALTRTGGSTGRFAWVGAAGLAGGAMFGYFVSRAIALPGMADHQGDWTGKIGVMAGIAEIALVLLAGFALRDRVLQREAERRAVVREQRKASRRSRLVAPAGALIGLLAINPALALAHGGEEMSDEEMAATDDAHAGMDMSGGGMEGMQGMAHDPLLGTLELFVAFLLIGSFVAWCGLTLRRRADLSGAAARASRERTRRHRSQVSAARNSFRPAATARTDRPAVSHGDTAEATQELASPARARRRVAAPA